MPARREDRTDENRRLALHDLQGFLWSSNQPFAEMSGGLFRPQIRELHQIDADNGEDPAGPISAFFLAHRGFRAGRLDDWHQLHRARTQYGPKVAQNLLGKTADRGREHPVALLLNERA